VKAQLLKAQLIAAIALMTASSAMAVLPTRTWVSSTGNDGNAGTRTSPFADFATAVANTAPGGTVSVVDPGDYGPVTITQSITIDGGGVGGSITSTGGEAVYISAGPTDTVILRNLSMDGAGQGQYGVYLSTGGALVIENCSIHGFTMIAIGIGSGAAQNLSVTNTTINGGALGVRTFQGPGPDTVTLRNVTITGTTSAAIFTRSGLLDVSYSTISQNNIALENDTNAFITAESNMISYNQTAVETYTGSKTFLSNNDMVGNTTGIASVGGTVGSAGNNKKDDNPTPGAPNAPMITF
jgi:parallel beta helix pectate lyase-like protein